MTTGSSDVYDIQETMSSVYITEPHTSGHVIFNTTHGPIDMHLWCNECPTITQYFLQLCLDGFYNDMYFHRIIPNLLIQTGIVRSTDDPVNATSDKEQKMMEYHKSIHAQNAYERRSYEVHSRIQFNHRGQVAMAMTNDSNPFDTSVLDVVPQFFIMTDEAPYLNNQHVIFGTVTGPTIFNVIRINQYSNEGNETLYDKSTPRIIDTKIVANPFEERMVVSSRKPWKAVALPSSITTKKRPRKGKFDTNVLSFGDDVDESAVIIPNKKFLISMSQSSESKAEPSQSILSPANETNEIHPIRKDPSEVPETIEPRLDQQADVEIKPSGLTDEIISRPADDVNGQSISQRPAMSYVEARRAKYIARGAAGRKTSKAQRDEDTYNRLLNFRSKLHQSILPSNGSTEAITGQRRDDDGLASRMARRLAQQEETENSKSPPDGGDTYHGQVLYSDDDRDPSWLATKFKCRKHMDLLSGDGKDALDEYEVIDSAKNKHHRKKKK
jgi:peptidyl-prolyl cis-trans isomerase SDCCAG10